MTRFQKAAFVGLLVASNSIFASIAYISGASEPWGMPGGVNGMNQVYGAGNWSRLEFNTAIANGAYTFDALYIDGGDGQTLNFENFIFTNRSGLESYVNNGGSLFLNAARWNDTTPFNLGFGVTLNAGLSGSGHIAAGQSANPIFIGTNSSWNGNWFSHDYLTGAGLTSVIDDGSGRSILAEMDYGTGQVMFGGLTLAFFGENNQWSSDTGVLRNNILRHLGSNNSNNVPEPSSIALIGIALSGLGVFMRKRSS